MLSTPCVWCVSPIAQRKMPRFASTSMRTASSICARGTPHASISSSHGVASTSARTSSKPFVCCSTKTRSSRVRLDDALEQRLEQRDVAADVRLEVEIGDVGAEEQAAPVRGNAEAHEPQLAQRVHDDHLAAALPHRDELGDQPRVVARRVRARDEREVCLGQVVEGDRGGARAVDAAERDARGGVAVERAVVDVRAAVCPREQLQQERGLVARAARAVEERLVRRRVGAAPRAVRSSASSQPMRRKWVSRSSAMIGNASRPSRSSSARGHEAQLGDRRAREVVLGDHAAHVAGLRLHRLLAELGEVARLVDHAAVLPAHARGRTSCRRCASASGARSRSDCRDSRPLRTV